ncbi:hypothetical protein U9M48_030350 [Paspalum notatum var. saurae]|uniref:Uncharacterized protein n=1 Tax=Paspalum notatum var. saurae TaxID=547442 RepID=A0AAQ3U195_PASNO
MAFLARAAAATAVAVRSAARSGPLSGRVLSAPLPSLASPSAAARSARILRRSAAAAPAALETLMPLHSAVAAARLRSCIAVDSSCWSSLSQGVVDWTEMGLGNWRGNRVSEKGAALFA